MVDDERLIGSYSFTSSFSSVEGADVMALAMLVIAAAHRSAEQDLKAIMDKIKTTNKKKEEIRCFQRKLAALAASKLASELQPGAILAAPEYSLNAAREACRWIEFVVRNPADDR
jgi:hypothetical protein